MFDVFLALYANPLRNRKMIAKLWNEPVELEGMDGEPIMVKVPVFDRNGEQKMDAKGKPMFKEMVPPLWLGITLGIGGHLKSSFYGSVAQRKRDIDRSILEGMTPDQAAWVTAIDLAQKGKYGQALISMAMPGIQKFIAGQFRSGAMPGPEGQNTPRGGSKAI